MFVHRSGIPDWEFWPDHTVGIPHFYSWAYLAVAQAALQRGDEAALERYRERAERWIALGS